MKRAVMACVVGWIFWIPCCPAAPALTWKQETGFRTLPVFPPSPGKPGFTDMAPSATGVAFTNQLEGDLYLTNAVAHNGAGIAIGDLDADGWPDLYFCNLQGPNRLYRNLGGWRFEETPLGEASCGDQLSTGATFADVDGDGDLDLLVNGIAAGTRLFLNDGTGQWTESKDSGLSRTSSSTSLALADIDGDGDLDLYCTHFIDAMLLADPTTRFALARRGEQWEVTKVNGESTRAPRWKGRFEALPGGKVRELPEVHGLYRNDGKGRFTAIEFEAGTYQDEKGTPIPPFRDWGLAAMFRDLNRDGHPDLYVCNDNTSPDRIWINTGKGTFRLIDPAAFRHTSRSSMGIDVGDLDRDGYDDLFVVDMLAWEHSKRMTQLVRDRPTLAESEQPDSRPQYNRNTLFLGRPDGSYVEAAFMAGVAATDWTWSPILLDVDLDGYEDLLITNGFEFDVMDQDGDDAIKDPRRRLTDAQLKRHMGMRPHFRTPNLAFRNRGDGTFEPVGATWGFDHAGVSFGMAQGDLDNDGDLDLVVNNLNEAASLYRNNSAAPRLAVRLKGPPANAQGVGARMELRGGAMTQAQEMICGGRYLSGDQAMRVFALPPGDSTPTHLEVLWPDGSRSTVTPVRSNQIYEISHASAHPPGNRKPTAPSAPLFSDVSSLLNHAHVEESFDDWARQPMLPRRLSRLGPGLAWYDGDGDGWEDLFVTSARGGTLAAFSNQQGRGFKKGIGAPVARGDQTAVVGWSDGQGHRLLLVATSNQEFTSDAKSELSVHALPQIDAPQTLTSGWASPGPLTTADVDGDGDLDLFLGGRFRPGRYPEPVASTVWLNENGKLVASEAWSAPFKSVGLVSGATFADIDDNGTPDLALAVEWGPVRLFLNRHGRFTDMTTEWGLASLSGWWTGITAGDFDGDGRIDLACGNWGRNSPYELFQPAALRLYYGDWNGDGTLRMIETWGSGTRWFSVQDRPWLTRGFPELGIRFPTHQTFAAATVQELLGSAFQTSHFLEATHLASTVFLNRTSRFLASPLPREAQLAPAFSMNVGDLDGDGIDDLFLSQNFFGSISDISRDDSGHGLCLLGTGTGTFRALDAQATGIRALGEQRGAALGDFNHDGRVDLAFSQNNGPTRLYANQAAQPGLRVVLRGPGANPDAVGAKLRLVYGDGRKGPCRVVQAGSGFGSQDAAVSVLGLLEIPQALWIRWPGGREQTIPVPQPTGTLQVVFEN